MPVRNLETGRFYGALPGPVPVIMQTCSSRPYTEVVNFDEAGRLRTTEAELTDILRYKGYSWSQRRLVAPHDAPWENE